MEREGGVNERKEVCSTILPLQHVYNFKKIIPPTPLVSPLSPLCEMRHTGVYIEYRTINTKKRYAKLDFSYFIEQSIWK